ncbi:phosphoadenosine phosphosulfate reductase [uncultured Shimia sp.]|uniref:phosphoadenosine phosphosulfate reductase n=1 Tax=uncultured Shimia sp. TaxID=573152 RepID=UPI0026198877|nr:phosphoadenosine phosphosulfate reductase [uncultured Shimia sp.]
MQDAPNGFDTPMLGLATSEWLEHIEEIAEEHGYFQPLGPDHFATFVEDKPMLVVTFESIESIQSRADTGQPLGFELVRELGWSHLCILSHGQSWFRDPAVYAFFDRLSDDGFFDEFDHVLFYGAGSCGYAAATYSLTAPGARVVAVNPHATLSPEVAGWDKRHKSARKLCFTDRYGYAPEMIEAAEKAHIIYSSDEPENAMHAALFRKANVDVLTMPPMGGPAETALMNMQILLRIMVQAGVGTLTRASFYKLLRARRDYGPYLRTLLRRLQANERVLLTAVLCANVTSRMTAPRFSKTLDNLAKDAVDGRLAG